MFWKVSPDLLIITKNTLDSKRVSFKPLKQLQQTQPGQEKLNSLTSTCQAPHARSDGKEEARAHSRAVLLPRPKIRSAVSVLAVHVDYLRKHVRTYIFI